MWVSIVGQVFKKGKKKREGESHILTQWNPTLAVNATHTYPTSSPCKRRKNSKGYLELKRPSCKSTKQTSLEKS